MRDYFRTMFFPFQNEQLKDLVEQLDIYIQLLYQFLLLSSSKDELKGRRDDFTKDPLKYKVYCMLYEFI